MDECCGPPSPDGYAEVFDARYAGKVARRYRRRGLTSTEQRLVGFLASTGIEGASVRRAIGEVVAPPQDVGAAILIRV